MVDIWDTEEVKQIRKDKSDLYAMLEDIKERIKKKREEEERIYAKYNEELCKSFVGKYFRHVTQYHFKKVVKFDDDNRDLIVIEFWVDKGQMKIGTIHDHWTDYHESPDFEETTAKDFYSNLGLIVGKFMSSNPDLLYPEFSRAISVTDKEEIAIDDFKGETRDPERIPRIVTKLLKVWSNTPDWRLGQLLINLTPGRDKDALWNLEDDILEKEIDEAIADKKYLWQNKEFFDAF